MIDIYDSKALYEKIDAMRKEKGLSINGLARRSSPTLSVLDALCSALGTTLINFLMDENDISENEELISVWNRLSREQQKSMIALMKSMV